MNNNKNIIGILGGMGPQASIRLVDLLVNKSVQNGAKEDSDFPEIILDSIPVPDFISDTKNLRKVLKILQKRIFMLSNMNISKLAIACNTAHILLPDLQTISDIKFVSIIDEVAKQVRKKGIKKVGLLATPTTIRFGLYQQALDKFKINVIIPSQAEQKKLEKIIRNILSGKKLQSDIAKLIFMANSLKERGAEGIILGCTELPLIFPEKLTVPIFNSLEILADSLLVNDDGVQ